MSVKVKQIDRERARSIYVMDQEIDGVDPFLSRVNDDHPLVQAFAAHRHQAEEAMRERAAGECVKYRLQCDMVAVQRSRDGEGSDAAIVCSLAAELLERTIRSIDTRGGGE